MIGTVQKKEFSKNGAAKFQINGTWYFLNRSVQNEFPPGTSVDFEFEEFGDDRGRGRPKAITRWRQAQNGHSTGQADGKVAAGQTSTVTEVDVLRSVSNIVGNACAAGSIENPEELEKWCVAARMGLSRAMSRAKVAEDESEPDFDDDIPF